MVKENTESKSEEKSDTSKKILILTNDQEHLRKQRNKRDTVVNSVILGFFLVLAIASAIGGSWTGVLNLVSISFWVALVWILERQISDQRYVIGMMSGLHELERQEIDTLLAALPPIKPTVKAKKETK